MLCFLDESKILLGHYNDPNETKILHLRIFQKMSKRPHSLLKSTATSNDKSKLVSKLEANLKKLSEENWEAVPSGSIVPKEHTFEGL